MSSAKRPKPKLKWKLRRAERPLRPLLASAGVAARRLPSGTPWSDPVRARRRPPVRQALPVPLPPIGILFRRSPVDLHSHVCVCSYLVCACVREPANRLSSRHPSCSCGPGRSWPGRHCDSNFPLAQSAPLTQRDGEREREKESAKRAYLVPQRRSIPVSISL